MASLPKDPLGKVHPVERVSTGVEGLDQLMEGGFPRGDLVLLAGHPGSGKTIFSAEFLYNGAAQHDEAGIYVSFAENRESFMRSMQRLGMDFQKMEQKGLFLFLDFATVKGKGIEDTLIEILEKVDSLNARRLVIDSFSVLSQAISDKIDARIILHSVLGKITHAKKVTTLLIVEKSLGSSSLGGGMEEFVSDAVIVLAQSREGSFLQRTLEVFKSRGTNSVRTCLQYDISQNGIIVYPPFGTIPATTVHYAKVTTGVEGLDRMLGGGIYKGSSVLVTGDSGTGKTVLALQFALSGALRKEKTLFISHDQTPECLARQGKFFDWPIPDLISAGWLKIMSVSADPGNVNSIVLDSRSALRDFKPDRFVVDNLSSMERAMGSDTMFQAIRRMTQLFRGVGITSLVTVGSEETSKPNSWIGPLVDVIISLRQVETESVLRRALVILKSRGMSHESSIREFEITSKGIIVEEKFADVEQILTGSPRRSISTEAWNEAFTAERTKTNTGAKG